MTPHEELLAEIDAALSGTGFWRGGRLDTIRWLVDFATVARSVAQLYGAFDLDRDLQHLKRMWDQHQVVTLNIAICAQCGSTPCEGRDLEGRPFCAEGCARQFHGIDGSDSSYAKAGSEN